MGWNQNKTIRALLMFMAVCCGIVWSFTNLSYDGEYQIAMAYRLLQGDRLFVEMWEPHQTSSFLPAALMWIYLHLFRTATGIVVYLQICGILIRAAIAVCLYRTLRRSLDEPVAYAIGFLFFLLSPKDYALPDFSNQQLWYSTLLLCCLLTYLQKRKKPFLLLAALCLCLDVLAYPSCAVIYFGVLGILACYSSHRLRDMAVFTGICAGGGIAFCGLLVFPDPGRFAKCVRGILALEPSHTENLASKPLLYLKEILTLLSASALVSLAVFAAVAIALVFWDRSRNKAAASKDFWKNAEKKQYMSWLWLLCCAVLLLAGFLANILSADHRNAYSIVFLSLVGTGMYYAKCLEGGRRQAYICGSLIGALELLATLILTDLPFIDSVVYGLPAILSALIPLHRQIKRIPCIAIKKGFYVCAIGFVLLLGLRCAYIRTPLTGRGQIYSSLSGLSIVRCGPALGLISNEEGVCRQRDSYPEWKELIRPGDKVWIVGGIPDTLGYLYEDIQVAAPSVMSTPYYSDTVKDYWRMNPDKYPDVIAAQGYMGNLEYELQTNQWLMSWLEEEYQPKDIVTGKYWIYYFREARRP